jgi:hypothetical protein
LPSTKEPGPDLLFPPRPLDWPQDFEARGGIKHPAKDAKRGKRPYPDEKGSWGISWPIDKRNIRCPVKRESRTCYMLLTQENCQKQIDKVPFDHLVPYLSGYNPMNDPLEVKNKNQKACEDVAKLRWAPRHQTIVVQTLKEAHELGVLESQELEQFMRIAEHEDPQNNPLYVFDKMPKEQKNKCREIFCKVLDQQISKSMSKELFQVLLYYRSAGTKSGKATKKSGREEIRPAASRMELDASELLLALHYLNEQFAQELLQVRKKLNQRLPDMEERIDLYFLPNEKKGDPVEGLSQDEIRLLKKRWPNIEPDSWQDGNPKVLAEAYKHRARYHEDMNLIFRLAWRRIKAEHLCKSNRMIFVIRHETDKVPNTETMKTLHRQLMRLFDDVRAVGPKS